MAAGVEAEDRRISLGRTAQARAVGDLVGSLECWRRLMGHRPPVGVLAAVTCVALLDIHCQMIVHFAVSNLCCCGHTQVVWPCSLLLRPQLLKTECVGPKGVSIPKSAMWEPQWIPFPLLSKRRVQHQLKLLMKDKMAVVAGRVEDSSVPCRRSTCRIGLVIPGLAVQEIEVASVAMASPPIAVSECAGSYQDLMKIGLFWFS